MPYRIPKRLSTDEVRSLSRLSRGATVGAVVFALLSLYSAMPYAPHLCVVSVAVAALAHLSVSQAPLLLLSTALLAATGCATVDLSPAQWTLTPRRELLPLKLRVTPPTELDQLVSGCNDYLLAQRDAAANDEQRARKRQRTIAVLGAAATVVVGSVTLSLKSYASDKAAALTGGIGSLVTGGLSGAGLGLLAQPDPRYEQRRNAIMAAWNAIETYSASTSQPDPAKLAELKADLRNACMGVLPR